MYSESFLRRFWKKVEKKRDDECWSWTASTMGDGYGQIKPDGGIGPNLYAHRVSYEIHFGPIPDFIEDGDRKVRVEICHKCDNTRCANPHHLFLGTRAKNAEDMARKMRSTWGGRSGTAKLSENDVREIRKQLSNGWSTHQLAARFDISQSQIVRIKHRKQWAKLD
ncbi:MAG TPA: HNH endonuclease [candidate division Zixibacteria bacterium]|nr:HNH endonuclease [candidate division Zixibacteria bacterium]